MRRLLKIIRPIIFTMSSPLKTANTSILLLPRWLNKFLVFSFFPFYIYKEKKEKNDKYRNLVISIVLTNTFHNYLYRRRRVYNYKILFFSFFSCVQELYLCIRNRFFQTTQTTMNNKNNLYLMHPPLYLSNNKDN